MEKKVFLLIGELNEGMVDSHGKITTQEILDMMDYSTLQKTLQKKMIYQIGQNRYYLMMKNNQNQNNWNLKRMNQAVEEGRKGIPNSWRARGKH